MAVRFATAVAAVLLAIAARPAATRSIPSYAGPYIMNVKRFVACSDNDTEAQHDASTLRFSHFNPAKPYEPQTVTGTLTIPFDLDDSFWVSVRVDKRANNQWKKNYFVLNRFPVGFCSTVRTNFPEGFARVLGPKSLTGRCNVPKKTYTFDHEPFNWTLANYPTLPYGSYVMELRAQQPVSNGLASNTSAFKRCFEYDIKQKP